MSKLTYTIRNYLPKDFDLLVRLDVQVHKQGEAWGLLSPLDLIESVGQPNHSTSGNLFIAERKGEIVGYAELRPELIIARVVLRWLINPKHFKRDLIEKLADRAISRAGELGIRTVHVNILHGCQGVEHLLIKMGFAFVRRFLELRLDFSKTDLPDMSRIAFRCRPMQLGEEATLTHLQNRTFAGSWGYNPNTVEEITTRISLPNCSPEDILLVFDSDKPVGYCWARINFWQSKAQGERTGRIYMMGVDPDYRGRGLGRQLLSAGLSYLQGKGLRRVDLTVDSENKAALTLYGAAGFEAWTSSLWYEKRLD
jgi:mycothiol synthase